MKAGERKQAIIDVLIDTGSLTVDDLAQRFSVSKMTIHRDLDELANEGLLRKIRGGATLESSGHFESDFRYRTHMAVEEKQCIARYAASFIESGMTVMLDDSSTLQTIVPFLLEKCPLTIITNNMTLITQLSEQSGIQLIALGGVYSRKFNAFLGLITEEALSKLRADLVFLSSSAIDGLMAFHQSQEVVKMKRLMLAAATHRYLLVDHQKFGRSAIHLMASLDRFDGVITTRQLDEAKKQALESAGIQLYFTQET